MTVKKYSSAIKTLREKKKLLVEEAQGIRRKIRSLKWKDTPGAQEAFRQVRESKRPGTPKCHGKRFLKPFRRPETGSERFWLRDASLADRREIRHTHLAIGLLMERPYLSMEPKCHESNKPSCAYILDLIHEALGENEALKAEWTQEKIVDLILVTPKREAA
jgi:hypothetical protein